MSALAGSIINDNGVAAVTALTYNPLEDSDAHDITYYMNVIVDQIDVEFMRTDGRNVEGVDVPYRFTQPMNMLVPVDETMRNPLRPHPPRGQAGGAAAGPARGHQPGRSSCSWWPR